MVVSAHIKGTALANGAEHDMGVIDQLKTRVPSSLKTFVAVDAAVELPARWNTGPEFVTKEIRCGCGCAEFYMRSVARTESRGLFKKRHVTHYDPPFYLSCAGCRRMALLFDPAIHGWDGQMPGASASEIDEGSLSLTPDRGTVVVNYSYQGSDNYEELARNARKDLKKGKADTGSPEVKGPF